MSTERVTTNESKKTTPASATLAGNQPVLRWSVSRKREVVLRLLRDEPLDDLSRELGVEIHKLEAWRDRALSGMELGPAESRSMFRFLCSGLARTYANGRVLSSRPGLPCRAETAVECLRAWCSPGW